MPEIFQLTGYKNSLVQRIIGTIRVDICIIKWIRVCDTPCKPSIGYSHVEMDIWNRNISGTTRINIYSIHLIHLFSWILLLHFCNFFCKKVPDYAHHTVGVGGFVVNEKDEILVIQERFLFQNKPHWKLPGGKKQWIWVFMPAY